MKLMLCVLGLAALVLWPSVGARAEDGTLTEPLAPAPVFEEPPAPETDQAAIDAQPLPDLLSEPLLPQRTIEDQPLANEDEARLVSRAFMEAIVAGDIQAAFQLLAPYFPVPDAKLQSLEEQTSYQLQMLRLGFGVPLEALLLKEERVNDVLIRHLYLERFERDALRWGLVFYRAHRGWLLNAVAFDTELDALFE